MLSLRSSVGISSVGCSRTNQVMPKRVSQSRVANELGVGASMPPSNADGEGDNALAKNKDFVPLDIDDSKTDEMKDRIRRLKASRAKSKETKAAIRVEKEAARIVREEKRRETHGVVFLGHIPHGLFEPQMKSYFSQFGTVTRLRLSRNRKTRASKHYAFIEFADPDVATIVAETMDGYILFEKVLTCKVVPKEKVHPNMFLGSGNPPKRAPNGSYKNMERHNRPRTAEKHEKRVQRLIRAERSRAKKLLAAGIAYDFDGFETQLTGTKSEDGLTRAPAVPSEVKRKTAEGKQSSEAMTKGEGPATKKKKSASTGAAGGKGTSTKRVSKGARKSAKASKK